MRGDVFADVADRGAGAFLSAYSRACRRQRKRRLRAAADAGVQALESRVLMSAAQSGRMTASVGPFIPQTLAPGTSGSAIVTVTNETNFPSRAGHVWLSLAHSSTPYVTDNNVGLGGVFVAAPIPIGKTRRFRLHFKIPSTVLPGTYYLSALITLSGAQTNATTDSPLTVT